MQIIATNEGKIDNLTEKGKKNKQICIKQTLRGIRFPDRYYTVILVTTFGIKTICNYIVCQLGDMTVGIAVRERDYRGLDRVDAFNIPISGYYDV